MNKRDALKLKRGDIVVFGDKKYTANCRYFSEGSVQFVTANGGIRVRVTSERSDDWAPLRNDECYLRWIPYHYVASWRRIPQINEWSWLDD